jgi:hypothetical protein
MDSDNSNSLLILVGMFDDYEKSVVAFYDARKANKTLSPLLANLTPANLKKECRVVCEERYDRKDDLTLRAFFEQGGDKETCLAAIKKQDIDKFRPLINFLAGRVRRTDEINIELLAWLIDFKPRPYDDRYVYGIPGADVVGPAPAPLEPMDPVEPIELVDPVKRSFNFGLLEGLIVVTILVIIIVGIRFRTGLDKRPPAPVPTGQEKCMFWDGDHYEPTACNPRSDGTVVIALDPEKLNHFRKITRPDTLTEASVGKVWWGKYDKNVEFYTDSGFHPLDLPQRLRRTTLYMIRKYCHPG